MLHEDAPQSYLVYMIANIFFKDLYSHLNTYLDLITGMLTCLNIQLWHGAAPNHEFFLRSFILAHT